MRKKKKSLRRFPAVNMKKEKVLWCSKKWSRNRRTEGCSKQPPRSAQRAAAAERGAKEEQGEEDTERMELRWNHSHSITWGSPEGRGNLHPGVWKEQARENASQEHGLVTSRCAITAFRERDAERSTVQALAGHWIWTDSVGRCKNHFISRKIRHRESGSASAPVPSKKRVPALSRQDVSHSDHPQWKSIVSAWEEESPWHTPQMPLSWARAG